MSPGVTTTSKSVVSIALGLQLDAVWPGINDQALESAVEAVDHADVIAIDVNLRVGRLDLETERSRVP